MSHSITISKTVATAVRPSPRVLETAAAFGLGVDEAREIAIIPRCEIPLPHLSGKRGIVFITGPSGSGKSTILKLIAADVAGDGAGTVQVHNFENLPPLQDAPLVDALDDAGSMTLPQLMSALSVAGLGDAFVMLRRPSELSDGQRHRLRLAQVIAMTMGGNKIDGHGTVILADEFGSTLDRITAKTVARNLRRWIDKPGGPLSFIAATAHDDVLEALAPEVLVWKGLGDEIEVVAREAQPSPAGNRQDQTSKASLPKKASLKPQSGSVTHHA